MAFEWASSSILPGLGVCRNNLLFQYLQTAQRSQLEPYGLFNLQLWHLEMVNTWSGETRLQGTARNLMISTGYIWIEISQRLFSNTDVFSQTQTNIQNYPDNPFSCLYTITLSKKMQDFFYFFFFSQKSCPYFKEEQNIFFPIPFQVPCVKFCQNIHHRYGKFHPLWIKFGKCVSNWKQDFVRKGSFSQS